MSFGNYESASPSSNSQERRISSKADINDISPEDIEAISDPEELRQLLLATLRKADSLQSRLEALEDGSSAEKSPLHEEQERLLEIRYGITELVDRMKRPYLVSESLNNAKSALEILAEKGQMNSIILEGQPGTGKTQWAYSEVGQELQEGKDSMLIHVRVKDTMRSQDLLYTVDNIQRLSDAQTSQVPEIIRNEATEWKKRIISGEVDPSSDDNYKRFSAKLDAIKELGESSKDLGYENYIQLGPLGEAIVQSANGKKVWLLIDEIEKGREELMTGMLDEIENLVFTITETGRTIRGDKKNMRIVVTTNTEESDKIPPSFRRRSLYHYVDYPTRGEMSEIIKLNYPNLQETLLDYALDAFYSMHSDDNLRKKPSTPELLSWIQVLQAEYPDGVEGVNLDEIPHVETLVKYNDDIEHLERQAQIRRNADAIWNIMTSREKRSYLIDEDYLGSDSDFAVKAMNETGLDFAMINDVVAYLRDELKKWKASEKGMAWQEQDDSDDDYDNDEGPDDDYDDDYDNDEGSDDDDY